MGWSFGPKPRFPKASLDALHTWTGVLYSYECIRSAFVGLTYYAAVRRVNLLTGDTRVFGCVVLVRYTRNGEMGRKEMSEDMGPCESRCPRTILALLDPPESEYAAAWRARCERNAAPVNPTDVAKWAWETRGAVYADMSPRYKRRWTNAFKRHSANQA